MRYHLNYNFVWLYFDKFYWGLLLGIELAAVSIVIGSAIGLSLALLHVDGPRAARRFVTAYVEFIRNQPLLLLVYLVFYGVPSIGGSSRHRGCITGHRGWNRHPRGNRAGFGTLPGITHSVS